jgi:hypothetical protein
MAAFPVSNVGVVSSDQLALRAAPLAAVRTDIERYLRWLQEARR